jgi:hypothetical protein
VGKLIKPLTPNEIYESLRGGAGTPLLDEGRHAANLQWQAEQHRADLITKQADLVRAGWQGTASDSASGAVKPLADSALVGSLRLAMAEKIMDRQSSSFHGAANSVRPVAAAPPEPNFVDMMWPFVDYDKKVADYQADAQHNINVFRGYDTTSEGHEMAMSDYPTADDMGGSITVSDGDDRIDEPGGGPREGTEPFGGRLEPGGDPGGEPGGGPGSGPGSGPDSGPGNGPGGGPGRGPAGGPGSVPGGQQQTSPNDFVPRPVVPPGSVPVPGGPAPGSPGPGGFVPGFTGGDPYGTGGSDPRGGSYGRGPGAGALERGLGIRGGALAAEEAAARRSAAAAARNSSGLMGGAPVGAGRGKGEDDDEHKRKVLIETDSEGLFGSDELTAPQVIGDDEYED